MKSHRVIFPSRRAGQAVREVRICVANRTARGGVTAAQVSVITTISKGVVDRVLQKLVLENVLTRRKCIKQAHVKYVYVLAEQPTPCCESNCQPIRETAYMEAKHSAAQGLMP